MNVNGWILVLLGTGLFLAVISDLISQRIPNWLTMCVAAGCLLLQFWFGQWSGLLISAAGLVAGLLCLLPFYLFGAMGAGDVKLMAAVGSAVGPWAAVVAVVMTILCGGVIALVYVGARGGLQDMLRRYGCMIALLARRTPHYLPPVAGEAAALRFPYALAIACGSTLSVWCMSYQCGLLV